MGLLKTDIPFSELLLGRRLRTEEQEAQKIGPLQGIPVLGLDALSSAAYGPEAVLTVLLPLGTTATGYIGPISAAIILILAVVYFSYRQTIGAYPNGGGSYTVASENLGTIPGLLAASALSLDYILNVAVAISAGVGAVVSALPELLPHTLELCLAILVFLTVLNLRGVRDAGLVFLLPTYAFLACLFVTLFWGTVKSMLAHGHPHPAAVIPIQGHALETFNIWLVLRAFASGCIAMTGVEAVSNGVPLFKDPTVPMAERTLSAIIGALILMLAGIAYLSFAYGIGVTHPGQAHYESLLSQLIAAVGGRGMFYYVTLGAVFAVLCLSANTSFADFPRLCRLLALDEYLPAEFAHPGRRLVYSAGIITLALCAGALLIGFGGITERLIPLFAVGAFLAFTLSQLGMVAHWRRFQEPHARRSLIINAAGAFATGATLVVIVIAKFAQGAWITVILLPILLGLFLRIRRNHEYIDRKTDVEGPLELDVSPSPIIVVPIKRLDRVARKGLRLAFKLSAEVQAVQVFSADIDVESVQAEWRGVVEAPARKAGLTPPALILLKSPYRQFFGPLLNHVRQLAKANPKRYVAVMVPEYVERRWYHFLLHSHRATLLKGLLLLRGGPQVIIINTPWYPAGEKG
jgi:amino acid transporter